MKPIHISFQKQKKIFTKKKDDMATSPIIIGINYLSYFFLTNELNNSIA